MYTTENCELKRDLNKIKQVPHVSDVLLITKGAYAPLTRHSPHGVVCTHLYSCLKLVNPLDKEVVGLFLCPYVKATANTKAIASKTNITPSFSMSLIP